MLDCSANYVYVVSITDVTNRGKYILHIYAYTYMCAIYTYIHYIYVHV